MERSLNAGTGPAVPRVRALLHQLPHTWQASRCQVRPGENAPVIEADLDADGNPELVVALNADGNVEWDHDRPRLSEEWSPESGLFLVTQAGGKHRVTLVQETGENVSLVAVADLIGDGHREIVWSQSDQGAHTCFVNVAVSAWDDIGGKLRRIPGDIAMASLTGFEIAGRDVMISGGQIASAGAGQAQRNHTDRYRVEADKVRLVDRRFDASDFAYDRLIDGVEAESWGKTADALDAYREAADPQRAILAPEAIPPPMVDSLTAAVHAFAKFRMGALLMETDKGAARQLLSAEDGRFAGLAQTMLAASDRAAGCAAAVDWVGANFDFLRALNPAIGYGNPCWEPKDVCGSLSCSPPG